jgi:hypothetical protein
MAQIVVTAGIDVSKGWLNVALWPLKAELQIDQTAAGYDQLAAAARRSQEGGELPFLNDLAKARSVLSTFGRIIRGILRARRARPRRARRAARGR